MANEPHEITQMLADAARGDAAAAQGLFPLVYDELHRLAAAYFRGEPKVHTLQPTALVHEAYLRLVLEDAPDWESRRHFFLVAAQAMRRILVEHARRRRAEKRGGSRQRVSLEEIEGPIDTQDDYVLALDPALSALGEFDPRLGLIVELRYFGGLNVDEAAELLGISSATVKRDWAVAKGWLHREITKRCTE